MNTFALLVALFAIFAIVAGQAQLAAQDQQALQDFLQQFPDLVEDADWNGTPNCSWGYVTCDNGNPRRVIALNFSDNVYEDDGRFPSSFGLLSALQVLDMDDWDIEGPFPESMNNLTNLYWLRIADCLDFPEWPTFLGSLHQLRVLDLSDNEFNSSNAGYGMQNLTNLVYLDLSDAWNSDFNDANVRFPTFYNSTNITYIDMSDNDGLYGPIPNWVRNFTHLGHLDLSDTYLSGKLPPGLGLSGRNNLTYLDLHGCYFSGEVPLTYSNLTRLAYLDLSDNFLQGNAQTLFKNNANLTDDDDSCDLDENYFVCPAQFTACCDDYSNRTSDRNATFATTFELSTAGPTFATSLTSATTTGGSTITTGSTVSTGGTSVTSTATSKGSTVSSTVSSSATSVTSKGTTLATALSTTHHTSGAVTATVSALLALLFVALF